MGIGMFRSQNKVVTYWDFQTNASSATTFSPIITSVFIISSKRISWDVGDGFYRAGDSLSYVFSGGSTVKDCRTVSRYNGDKIVSNIDLSNQKMFGTVNLSGYTNVKTISVVNNPDMSSLILPNTNSVTWLTCSGSAIVPQNISGVMDISNYTAISNFQISHCPKITQIINPVTNSAISNYIFIQNGSYSVTGITGTLIVSGLTGLGGSFSGQRNPNLTSVILPTTNGIFNNFNLIQCNLTGVLDVSGLNNLGGSFNLSNNSNLTNVTHCYSPQNIISYNINNCNITGNHDMSMFPNLGGGVDMSNNSSLTGITHTASTKIFTGYRVYNSNLTGTHDISMFPNWGGPSTIKFYNNPNLVDVIFPYMSGGSFLNSFSIVSKASAALALHNCSNLGYVNFLKLSATTMNTSSTYGAAITLSSCNLSTSEVNHLLVDFDTISTLNPTGWSGVTLDILTGNSSPDSSSGGYDGISAINSLTGSPKNWVIA